MTFIFVEHKLASSRTIFRVVVYFCTVQYTLLNVYNILSYALPWSLFSFESIPCHIQNKVCLIEIMFDGVKYSYIVLNLFLFK